MVTGHFWQASNRPSSLPDRNGTTYAEVHGIRRFGPIRGGGLRILDLVETKGKAIQEFLELLRTVVKA